MNAPTDRAGLLPHVATLMLADGVLS